MYQRKRSSGFGFFRVIFIGILLGGAFFAYDRWRTAQDDAGSPPQVVSTTDDTNQQPINDNDSTADQSSGTSSNISDFVSEVSADARIFIPSVGIDERITQAYLDGTSWDVSHLGTSIGHLQGTSWVNDGPGNVVLSGHVELSDGRRGVFAELDEMNIGDMIILTENGEEIRYIVVAIQEVQPDDLTPLYPTAFDRLTLITCGGYDFFSDEYRVRTVVTADRAQAS